MVLQNAQLKLLVENSFYQNEIAFSATNLFLLFFLQRVMPSGFFILLNYFLRVDGVVIRMNGTRYHYEVGNDFILKEYTAREAKFDKIKHVIFDW